MSQRIAIITGGANGIGKSTALQLASEGVHVIITDINAEAGDKLVEEIVKTNGSAEYHHMNVADQEEVSKVASKVKETHKYIDYAVNNAGVGGVMAPSHEIKKEDWDRVIDVNMSGVMYCLQEELKLMMEHGGSIVNIASIAGQVGFPYCIPYSATKHAVIGMTKTIAMEYARHNIRCNVVCPSFTETDIITDLPVKILEFSKNYRVPMRRHGKPSEIAEAIVWLLSDKASYMNGHVMNVDGGYSAG